MNQESKNAEVQESLFLEKSGKKIIIGKTQPMQDILHQIRQFGRIKGTVFITGERGVGKDLVAQAIHQESLRRNKTFKPVDCGALADTLLESEIFGHEKGAFTGADKQRKGAFEQVNKGTLFLDEIGNLSLKAQRKFMRVLETQEFTRLGGEEMVKVDVRVIAATNIDLKAAIRKGEFKADLLDRLNLFRIHIPPLRERPEDIPSLVDIFIDELKEEHKKDSITGISQDASNYLQSLDWHGNIRELRNAIERVVVLSNTEELQLKDFTSSIKVTQHEDEEPQLEDATSTIQPVNQDASLQNQEFLRDLISTNQELTQRLSDISSHLQNQEFLRDLISTNQELTQRLSDISSQNQKSLEALVSKNESLMSNISSKLPAI